MIKKTTCFILVTGILVIFFSCFEKPLTPILPEWDVVLNIPILKEYTMGEMFGKDTVFSYDNTRDSVIQYTTGLRIEPFNPSDKNYLKIKTNAASRKILLSEIKFQPLQTYDFSYSINQVFSNLNPGTNTIVPAIGSTSKTDESILSSFKEFQLDSGKMIITINNQFPFDVKYESIKISNNSTDNKSEIGVWTNKSIPAKSFLVDSSINLSGKKILNTIKVEIVISTPGTNGRTIYLSPDDKTMLNIRFSDFKIRSATAAFNSQFYRVINYTSMDEEFGGININNSSIKSGKLFISIENYTNLGSNLKITFPEIIKNNIAYQVNDIYLPPNQKVSERSYDLSQSKIYPVNGKEFSSVSDIYTTSTNNNLISLNGSDSIRYNFRLEDITIESINGKVKSSITQIFNLPVNDIERYFDGSVDFSLVEVQLGLNNGTGIPIELKNGVIKGYNRNTGSYEFLPIQDTVISSRTFTRIQLNSSATTNFFNKFSKNNQIPQSMDFSGDININTNNTNYYFTSADTIGGYVNIRIPLRMALKNVVYRDTFDFSFSEDNKKQIDKFNSGRIKLNISSYIPVNFNIIVGFFNFSNQSILSLPRLNEAPYMVSSAEIDNTGNVINPTISEVSFELFREDIVKIRDSKYCEFKIQMNTPANPYVTFKKNSAMKIRMSTEFGYKISTK